MENVSTGFVVEDNKTVVTAGHSIYYDASWGFAIEVGVCIGYNAPETTEHQNGSFIAINPEYLRGFEAMHDFAVIRLEQGFSQVLPFPWLPTPSTCKDLEVEISGFAGDKPDDARGYKEMWSSTGIIIDFNGSEIWHILDTERGKSDT
jgi:V8-like Glu-specific endopeptidase